ncbi:MAG: hypothetical protein IPL40_09020 [Proteobacteria bacterium]|nr:hypothetical protein [Pseudomonadota bacterium]
MAVPAVIALSVFAGTFVLSPTHIGAAFAGLGSAVLSIASGFAIVAAAVVVVPPVFRWAAERVAAGREGREPQLGLADFLGAHLALNVAPVVHSVADLGTRWAALAPLTHLHGLGASLENQLTDHVQQGLRAIAQAQAAQAAPQQRKAAAGGSR